jgi:rhamnose utilization protein RhaD (predicted bifunctional aldolase and dehydrogenase)
MVGKIFGNQDFETAWIPYINPGFCLTLKIREAVSDCLARTGKAPEVFFMENHGLIVTSDDCAKAVKLHAEINDQIRDYFGINEVFPAVELFHVDDQTLISKTGYISNFIQAGNLKRDFFEKVVLYPDQFVYLNGNIGFNSLDHKLNIITETGEVIYKTNATEAQTMEETLLACIYVVNEIGKRSLPLKTMTEKDIDFIRNWESEAYRRSLVKEMTR